MSMIGRQGPSYLRKIDYFLNVWIEWEENNKQLRGNLDFIANVWNSRNVVSWGQSRF